MKIRETAAKQGRPRGPAPAKADLVRLYVRRKLTIRETAAALGLTRDTAQRWLKRYGIERRARTAKRAALDIIPLKLIEAGIKADGLRAHARRLGVSAPALLYHVRTRRERAAAKSK